ncbi:hypothetical protein HK100_009913 [Physocladia obscura]|uniref:NACHT domain-containing protein n=1 Tax=Physocladia obscura TaxID=109957 RepID=A0AAD5T3R2_9FUNG|nr:hypothetical protein HK100_009913 [Physocladia obscura]
MQVLKKLDYQLGVDATLVFEGKSIQNDEDVLNMWNKLKIPDDAERMSSQSDTESEKTSYESSEELKLESLFESTKNQYSVAEAVFPVSAAIDKASKSPSLTLEDRFEHQIIDRIGGASEQNFESIVDELDWLAPVSFNSLNEKFRDSYVPNTRIWAVKDFNNWIKAGKTSTLCHLGGAGVGKTMVAWLIREKSHNYDYVVPAYFHCKHDDSDKNNPKSIITTLAYQLAQYSPGFNRFIKEVKRAYDVRKAADSDLVDLVDLANPFKRLILDGLGEIEQISEKPLVLIIDALDECGRQGDLDREYLLSTIASECQNLPSGVFLLVTSRPENDIVSKFDDLKTDEINIRDSSNMADIIKFVKHKFKQLDYLDGDYELRRNLIFQVAAASDGLFVFADLSCKEIVDAQKRSEFSIDGNTRLQTFVDSLESQNGLDGIYKSILERVYTAESESELLMFRSVMGVVCVCYEALSSEVVAFILKVSLIDVESVTGKIRSILYKEDGKLTVLHKTVKDYLVSSKRNADGRFFINASSSHNLMTERSFHVINSVQEYKTMMQYASRNWASHLENGRSKRHIAALEKFVSGRHPPLFDWIEIQLKSRNVFDSSRYFRLVLTYLSEVFKENPLYFVNRPEYNQAEELEIIKSAEILPVGSQKQRSDHKKNFSIFQRTETPQDGASRFKLFSNFQRQATTPIAVQSLPLSTSMPTTQLNDFQNLQSIYLKALSVFQDPNIQSNAAVIPGKTSSKPFAHIESVPANPTNIVPSYEVQSFDVMLSYQLKWDSQKKVGNVVNRLKNEYGLTVYFDVAEQPTNIYEAMADAIRKCKVFVPFLTERYQASKNSNREIQYACDLKKPIVPARDLKPGIKEEGIIYLITAGLLYIDFSGIDEGMPEFDIAAHNLYNQIANCLFIDGKLVEHDNYDLLFAQRLGLVLLDVQLLGCLVKETFPNINWITLSTAVERLTKSSFTSG